jgi:hypothetical protein
MPMLENVRYAKSQLEEKGDQHSHCNLSQVDYPFQQWGLDIIGEINPNSSQLHKYILKATDYFTRWTEAIPLKVVNEDQVISFLNSHIVTRFGVPQSLVFDNEKYFSSLKLTEYALENNIKMKYAANYYP